MSKLVYPKHLLDKFRAWGAKGGERRAVVLSKQRRIEIARNAGKIGGLRRGNGRAR